MIGKYTVAETVERSGVNANTLRQWERRYGFPRPERADSGYRYYSDDDLELIGKMRAMIADGVPPSRAATILRHGPLAPSGARSPQALSHELEQALSSVDPEAAEGKLSEAIASHPLDVVLLEVIGPAMTRIGEKWRSGSISVATEHFASNLVLGRLRTLLALMPTPRGGHHVLVACAPGEQHEIGALILAVILKRAGLRVIYLGANTPIVDLVDMVRRERADAVLLSVTMSDAAAGLRAERMRLRSLDAALVLGGSGVEREPDLAGELGGVFLGNDLTNLISALESLLSQVADETSKR